jgi:outer membrane protein OmpA-like peptidoglycan-associated protein/tetratricopeptide (TPR) repeat protein
MAFMLISFQESSAQMKRADNYYESMQYTRAIPLYARKAKTGNMEATIKLGDCYRKVRNYMLAEIWYRKAVEHGNTDKQVNLNFGEVLRSNGKLDEAKQQFQIYLTENSADRRAQNLLQSCEVVKDWAGRTEEFKVENLKGLNTNYSEFSAVNFKAGVVFVSDRGQDFIDGNSSGWTERPYFSVYYTERKPKNNEEFAKPVNFSHKINTDYHNGPVSFNKDQSFVTFTRVDLDQDSASTRINRPKLYFASIKDKVTFVERFPYNSQSSSTAHGSLTPEGDVLYFASDMPGGYGGMDLYYSKKVNGQWEKPVNLGSEINTNGNEVFPFIDANGVLYFSSDGHIGYGGLDVYSSERMNDVFGNVKNLYAPINSPYDDFGIYFFKPGRDGYLTSNRPGGAGEDDIYTVSSLVPPVTEISGNIMANELDAGAGMNVRLLNAKGEIVATAITDEKGDFKFVNLNPDDQYLVVLAEEDVQLKTKDKGQRLYGTVNYNNGRPASNARLVVMNNERVVVRELTANEKGFFKFTKLQADMTVLSTLDEMNDADLASLKLNSISGTLMKGENNVAANIPVRLVNDKGEVIATGTTDSKGNFKFDKLPPDQNYIVMIDSEDGGTDLFGRLKYNNDLPGSKAKILVVDKTNQPVRELVADTKGFFNYKNLPADERYLELVDETETRLANLKVTNISGKLMKSDSEVASNIKVKLVDDKGNVVGTGTTDAKGEFHFEKLNPDANYIVMIDESDAGLNEQGLSNFYGRLRYNNNEPGSKAKLAVVNKKNEVVKEFVADKRGFFNFQNLPSDEKYLGLVFEDDPELNLSNTISIVGKIMSGVNMDIPVRLVKVTLKTKDGTWVRDVRSDNQGFFRFANLKSDNEYVVFVDETDPQLRNFPRHLVLGKILRSGMLDDPAPAKFIAIGGGTGIVMKETTTGEDGFFKFEVLSAEYAGLATMESSNVDLKVKGKKVDEVIYFPYGRSVLTDDAKRTLDRMIANAKTHPYKVIYIDGHADSRATYGHNMWLSENRANAVAEYVVAKGISKNKLKVQRFGETKLVNKCSDGEHCTDPEHQLNRRVEIRIEPYTKPAVAILP